MMQRKLATVLILLLLCMHLAALMSAEPAAGNEMHVAPGDVVAFPILISNNASEEAIYSFDMVELTPRISWNILVADEITQEIVVPPAGTTSGTLAFSVPSTLNPGTYPFSLEVSGAVTYYINGTILVELPVLSVSSPEIDYDGGVLTIGTNISATGNVSAKGVVISLYIDRELSDSVEYEEVPAGMSLPVYLRGAADSGMHEYNITVTTHDGYAAVYQTGDVSVPEKEAAGSPVLYILLALLIGLATVSEIVRRRRKKDIRKRDRSAVSLRPEEMLRLDREEGSE